MPPTVQLPACGKEPRSLTLPTVPFALDGSHNSGQGPIGNALPTPAICPEELIGLVLETIAVIDEIFTGLGTGAK